MYDDFEGESIYEIHQIDPHDSKWIDEKYLEKNIQEPTWINFL